MPPAGVTLIALYHFLAAALLALLAIALMVGGTVLGGMFASGASGRFGGALGLFVGVVGAAITLVFALVAGLAGYGAWNLREWGRILCIALAAIALLFSVPGLLMMGLHLGFFFGGYRLIWVVISA